MLRACAAAALTAGQTESLGLLDGLPVDPNAPLGGGDGTNPTKGKGGGKKGPDGVVVLGEEEEEEEEVLDADDDGVAPDRSTVNLWVTLAALQGVPQPPPPPPSEEELAEAAAEAEAAAAAAAAGGKGGGKKAPPAKKAPPGKGGKAAAGGKAGGKGAAGGEEAEEAGEFDHVRYFVRLVPPGQPASSVGDAVAASLAATSAALDFGVGGDDDYGTDDAAITTAVGGGGGGGTGAGTAAAAAAAAARALTGHTTSRMVYSASMEPGFAQTLALRPSVALRDDVLFNGFVLQVFEETLAPRPTPPAEGSEAAEALAAAAAAAAEAAEAAGEPPLAGWPPVQTPPRAVQRVEMVGMATCRLAQLLTPQHPHEMVGEANTVRLLLRFCFAFASLVVVCDRDDGGAAAACRLRCRAGAALLCRSCRTCQPPALRSPPPPPPRRPPHVAGAPFCRCRRSVCLSVCLSVAPQLGFEGLCTLELTPAMVERKAALAAAAAADAAEAAGAKGGKGGAGEEAATPTAPQLTVCIKLNWKPPPAPEEPVAEEAEPAKPAKGKAKKGKK